MEAKQEAAALFTYSIRSNTGYEAEGRYDDVTPDQYRQVVAALNGTLKEANPAHDDLVKALQRAIAWCDENGDVRHQWYADAKTALAKAGAA